MHVVPHSHMDTGWEKTVDEYYSGLEGKITHAGVEQIFTNTINELVREKNRRFTFAEIKLFSMWFSRQNLKKQD